MKNYKLYILGIEKRKRKATKKTQNNNKRLLNRWVYSGIHELNTFALHIMIL